MKGYSSIGPRTVAYLLFIVLIVIYLLNVHRVYHVLTGKSYPVKLGQDFSLRPKGDLQLGSVDDSSPINNQFEEGKLFKAGFVRPPNESSNTRLRVFIRSPDALYEVIENRRSFWANLRKSAVNVYISTSGLKKGIYQIGLYLSDDQGARFAWTSSVFEKVKGGPVDYFPRPVALAAARMTKDLKFSIERISQEKEALVFQGWAVLDQAEMEKYNSYIKIESSDGRFKTFYAPLYTRMDIASLYDDARAANSGLRIKVPRSEFAPGEYAIRIVLKNRQTGDTIEARQPEIRKFSYGD